MVTLKAGIDNVMNRYDEYIAIIHTSTLVSSIFDSIPGRARITENGAGGLVYRAGCAPEVYICAPCNINNVIFQ